MIFSANGSETTNWTFICKKDKLQYIPTTLHKKNNPKWITGLNIKCKTVKIIWREQESFHDLGLGNKLLITSSKHKAYKIKF